MNTEKSLSKRCHQHRIIIFLAAMKKPISIALILNLFAFIIFAHEFSCSSTEESCSKDDVDAFIYFDKLNEKLKTLGNREKEQSFNYYCNITEVNRLNMVKVSVENAEIYADIAREIKSLGFVNSKNPFIFRQAEILTRIGFGSLSKSDLNDLKNAISEMESNYASVLVCEYNNSQNCKMSLEPEIEGRIRESRDPEELKYYWKEFYDKAGTAVKSQFLKYIELSKKAAKINGFESYADDWIDKYEDQDFEKNLEEVYQELLPFYSQLHGYVRHRLREKYGVNVIDETGNIPMHLLGNLWGQQWHQIIELITPFPEKQFINIGPELLKQGYTPVKIFQTGDDFFKSLNMTPLTQDFWNKSVLEKPTNRKIMCHASAWDFFKKNDVRIKQCTEVNDRHFYIAHHELGHIQYYLLYQHQPVPFRYCPNPGFHEAVGDTISLSVSSPTHLERIGLLKDFDYDEETRINQLFLMAIQKIAFMPFAYTMDKYRYEVFRNNISSSELNCAFWKMRSQLGGIEPAVERSENDFDPPAKFHISSDTEYLRYFTAHVFQFQFHKAACITAGQYVPGDPDLVLDNCDIYGSTSAGNAFKAMLELGASHHWKFALKMFTGEENMTATPMLEFFEPLIKWLESENKRLNVKIGWEVTNKCKRL